MSNTNVIQGIVLIMLLITVVTSCQTTPQFDTTAIENIPVVKINTGIDDHEDYVLLVPAGETFRINLSVKGYMLKENIKHTLVTAMDRDVYLYKTWLSFDRKSWRPLNQVMNLELSMGMDNERGYINIELIEKPKS